VSSFARAKFQFTRSVTMTDNIMEMPSATPATRVNKLKRRFVYACKMVPLYAWQRIVRRTPRGRIHLIIAIADHFEPSSLRGDFAGYAPRDVQEKRVEKWCTEYAANFREFRDSEGRPFIHTYFYPAEQYDRVLVEQVAELCHSGWGELEIHLHHGVTETATAASTRAQILSFRDALAHEHGCLSYEDGDAHPKYAFVHGNFALANSAGGFGCGVNNEMEILAETGCYVDMTYPTSAFHPAQIAKLNSMYECALPLHERAPHRHGRELKAGRRISTLPFLIQGPSALDFDRNSRNTIGRIENGALTAANPPSIRRLGRWERAAITVHDRPDWLFIKLGTHGMNPTDTEMILGRATQEFLKKLIQGAPERQETLHFVSAREMANMALAACDGREGNPGDYRDYRYRLAEGPLRRNSRIEATSGVKA
jgi:hypothetical protein